MPEQDNTSGQPGSQVPTSGQGQVPNPPVNPQVGDSGTQSGGSQQPQMTAEQLQDALTKVRAENAQFRTQMKRLSDLEAQVKAAEDAKLSDLERKDKQLADYQSRIAALEIEQQQYRLAREIAKHAPSLNLIDPDAAMLMLTAGGELDYDSDGKPSNVAKLLEKLVAEKPYLVASNVRPPAPPVSSGGATNPSRSAANTPPASPAVDPKELYKNRKGLANPNLWKK